MRYEELPASLRSKVDAQLGNTPGRTRNRSEAKGGKVAYRCVPCGQTFGDWGGKDGAEVHARTTGHVRQEMVMP